MQVTLFILHNAASTAAALTATAPAGGATTDVAAATAGLQMSELAIALFIPNNAATTAAVAAALNVTAPAGGAPAGGAPADVATATVGLQMSELAVGHSIYACGSDSSGRCSSRRLPDTAGGPGVVDAVPVEEVYLCTSMLLTSPGCRSSCYCC